MHVVQLLLLFNFYASVWRIAKLYIVLPYVTVCSNNFDSVVTSLATDGEVKGSISGSAVSFFSSGQLFHSMYRLSVTVLQFPFATFRPVLSYEELPCTVLTTRRGDLFI